MGGTLKIVTSSDLGVLGATDGPPVEFQWIPAYASMLLPWLPIFGLLVLKPNRKAAAWLILLPLGLLFLFSLTPPLSLPTGAELFMEDIGALAVGVAAVWLLPNYLRTTSRFLTFLRLLCALIGFSALAFFARQNSGWIFSDALPSLLLLALCALSSAMALSLAGRFCRRSNNPVRLYLWVFLWLVVIWGVFTSPVVLIAVSSGENVLWESFLAGIVGIVAANFTTLLPFLILSSAHSFYRAGLNTLLHAPSELPPVLSHASVNA